MSSQNLCSRRTHSDPAVPSTLDTTLRMDESETRSDSPLTPIESDGLSRAPLPKGQGYESALSEPDEAESFGPVEIASEHPKTSGAKGGREEPPALHRKSRTEEPAVKTNAVTNTQILASMSEMKEKQRDSQECPSHLQEMIKEFQTWQRQETEQIEAKYEAKIEELKKVYTTKATAPAENLGLQDHCSPTAEPESMESYSPHLSKTSVEGWFIPRTDKGTTGRTNGSGSLGNPDLSKEKKLDTGQARPSQRDRMSRHQLSEQQKNEYRAVGKYFECGETGHRSQNCPRRNSMKLNHKRGSEPPGLSTHNIEFELPEVINQGDVWELSLNAAHLNWFEDVEETYYSETESIHSRGDSMYEDSDRSYNCPADGNGWNSPGNHLRNSEGAATVFAWPKDSKNISLEEAIGRGLHNHLNHEHFGFKNDPVLRRFGDPLAERLEYVLTQQTPFPGHLLIDSAYEDRELQIPTQLLINPDFEPGPWFARQIGDSSAASETTSRPMGDARATRISQILNNAECYPGDDLPDFHPRQDVMYDIRWPLNTTLLTNFLRDCLRWNMWEARMVWGDLFDPSKAWGSVQMSANNHHGLELNGVQIAADKYPGLQRNAVWIKGPGPVIVVQPERMGARLRGSVGGSEAWELWLAARSFGSVMGLQRSY
ncbi:hypothetical protein F5890DRAFT_1589505 [Lentinula detonsa]|uniref:CCHC-type domain-containing protein n=1 Tax=Lentinula detonsa TaxID=2804962 RepID=A0AA38PNV0_9AGAR|nr:hypothetical protein F5890DRAFT_1589505 [Lentinula detonsa]